MQTDGEQVALLVDGELARELAAGGDNLEELELAAGGVNLEVDERVGGDGLGRIVKVGDGGAVLGAGRDDEVVCVRLKEKGKQIVLASDILLHRKKFC